METNIFALVWKNQIQILIGIRKHLTVCTFRTAMYVKAAEDEKEGRPWLHKSKIIRYPYVSAVCTDLLFSC